MPYSVKAWEMVKRKKSSGMSKRKVLLYLALPLMAAFTFFLTGFLAVRPHLTEQLYANSLYPIIAASLSAVSKHFPFSLGDLLYGLLAFTLIALPVLVLLKRITIWQWLLGWINLAAGVYVLFYWLWGFNYFRQDFNSRLGIEKSKADEAMFMQVFADLIKDANVFQQSYHKDYSSNQIDSLIEEAYASRSEVLKLRYPMGSRRAKPVTLGHFFAKAGISGYYGPFLNEINVNPYLHPLELPVILAHEKAHQFGITSEAEAGFYAWYICSGSQSDYLKYSASLYLLRYFLNHGHRLGGFDTVVAGISKPVRDDLVAIRDHWLALRNEKIDRIAAHANNAYLKTNRISAGIEDYKGVVALVMDLKSDPDSYSRFFE